MARYKRRLYLLTYLLKSAFVSIRLVELNSRLVCGLAGGAREFNDLVSSSNDLDVDLEAPCRVVVVRETSVHGDDDDGSNTLSHDISQW